MAGGMPLAFTQEDFLVKVRFFICMNNITCEIKFTFISKQIITTKPLPPVNVIYVLAINVWASLFQALLPFLSTVNGVHKHM